MPAPSPTRSPWTVVGLGFAAIVFDGYDLIVYGSAVPALLAHPDWHLTPAQAGMPDEYLLDRPGGEVMYHLRHLHYPPQDAVQPGPDPLGCGAHTDYGTVTLLADDGIGGLQVMRRDGTWIDVLVPDDRLDVYLGDLMAIWTNDRWVSNPHRVVNPPHRHRYSMPLFVTPPFHAEISFLPTCLEPGEQPRHAPQESGAYLMGRLDATHSYRNPLLAQSASPEG